MEESRLEDTEFSRVEGGTKIGVVFSREGAGVEQDRESVVVYLEEIGGKIRVV